MELKKIKKYNFKAFLVATGIIAMLSTGSYNVEQNVLAQDSESISNISTALDNSLYSTSEKTPSILTRIEKLKESQGNLNWQLQFPVLDNYEIDKVIQDYITNLKWSFQLSNNINLSGTNEFSITCEEFFLGDNFYSVIFNETQNVYNEETFEKIHLMHFDLETNQEISSAEILSNYINEEKIEILKNSLLEYLKSHLYGEIGFAPESFNDYRESLNAENVLDYIFLADNSIKFCANGGRVLPLDRGVVKMDMSIELLNDLLGEDFFLPEPEPEPEPEIIEEPKNPWEGTSGIFEVEIDGKIVLKQGDIIDPTKPMVALTYDDGPNPINTNRILDALEKHNVVATFFDIGSLIDRYPEVVQRQVALGCEIGNHSYNHADYGKLSASQIKADYAKTDQAYISAVGFAPTLFRPPYGSTNSTVQASVSAPVILWSIDTLDWKSRNTDSIMNIIYKQSNFNGQVILMHGIYESTARATEIMIPYLLGKGYQLVTTTDLIEMSLGRTTQAGQTFGYNSF